MKQPTLKDRLEYSGVMLFVRIVRCLSHERALRFAAVLGRFAFDVLGFRRKVTLSNLERHLPQCRMPHMGNRIGRASYINFGMNLAEFARLPLVDEDFIRTNIHLEGLEHLDRALDEGKGAILVTGHFGSWELMGCVLVRMGYPVKFVVGIQRNPLVQRLMNDLRVSSGIGIIEATSSLKVLRALKANRFVAMLSDQDAGRKGVFVDFLGARASTPQGPGRLAVMTGAPVIPGFIVRIDGTRQRIVIEKPIGMEIAGKPPEPEALTQAYSQVIEAYVKQHPEHWLWAHRRWKSRPV
jgi:KDO2-lipid IV(A) lauroyltransferase